MGTEPCLGLPDSQRRPRQGRKHVPAPRRSDCQYLAMYVVLGSLRPAALRGASRVVCKCLVLCLLVLHSIVRDDGVLGIGVLGGRKHRGRRDGPVRHGARWAVAGCICICICAWPLSLRGGAIHRDHAS